MPILNENLINIQENPKNEDINNFYIYCLEKQTTKWKSLNNNNIFMHLLKFYKRLNVLKLFGILDIK